MMFLETGWWDIGAMWRWICALICEPIYSLLANLYELFFNLASVEVFTNAHFAEIYRRVQSILTVVMVFYIMFEFIKYIVQPDFMTDKEKGTDGLIKRIVISVLLLVFTPFIFNAATTVQNSIIKSEFLSKVMIGRTFSNSSSGEDATFSKLGRTFSANILSMFYYSNPEYTMCNDDAFECEWIVGFNKSELLTNGSISSLQIGLDSRESGDVTVWHIHFDPFFAVAVGAFVLYIFILYSIQIGRRVFHIAFLRLIAPIPIVSYMSSTKEGLFQKWYKQCITVYLDMFIRLLIIYFVLFVCNLLLDARSTGTLFNGLGDLSEFSKNLIYIFLVLGLLLFAQMAPKLIQDLFPSLGSASGSFGLKPGDYFTKSTLNAARKATKTGLRVATGAAGAALGGLVGAGRRSFAAGRMRRKMNKQILEERKEQGKSTNRSDINKERRAARKEYHKANREFRKESKGYQAKYSAAKTPKDRQNVADEYMKKKNQLISNADDFAEKKRLDTRNSALTAAANLVTGAASGVVTGMKAKNASGVFKQAFSETAKKDQTSLNKSMTRMQTGASFGDVVSSKFGGSYSSVQRTENEIENSKAKIAEEKRLAEIELGVNKADEASKGRFASLAEKGDLNVLSDNQKIQYLNYDNDVEIAEQALKDAVTKRAPASTLDDLKKKLNAAKINKIKGQKSLLENARGAYFNILTTMSEADIDAKIKSKELDGPAINLIKAELTSIENSKSNSKTYDEVMRKLQASYDAETDLTKKKQIQDAMDYYSGKTNELKEWAVFDIINSTLQGNASDREINISEMQTNVSHMENSEKFKTQKALANEKKG